MTELNPEDQALLEEALTAQAAMADLWPVHTGWEHRWIGTGNESKREGNRWQCQSLRTIIFVKPGDDSGPDQEHRWILSYTHEHGFGSPIDRNAPPVSKQFHDIVPTND